MAEITISGSLTDDPKRYFTTSGEAFVAFSVVESLSWREPDKQTGKQALNYFDVVAWGRLGEQAEMSLSKGGRVVVIGHIDNSSESTLRSGRAELEVTATEIAVSL